MINIVHIRSSIREYSVPVGVGGGVVVVGVVVTVCVVAVGDGVVLDSEYERQDNIRFFTTVQ